MAQISLSASTLKLYLECPRCFWLLFNKRIARPRGPFPSLPTGMDAVLKRYFETYRHRGVLPPLIDGKLNGTLIKQPLSLNFMDAKLNARLTGKLDDCLVLVDGRHAPLDHKTRASSPNDTSYTEQYYKFQMDVYSLLLERNGCPISKTAYVIYYYPLDGNLHEGFPFGVTIHRISTDPEGAYKVFAAALDLLAAPCPSPSDACDFCHWLKMCQAL
jgi:hypothetical protein